VSQQNVITIIAPYNKKFIDEWQRELTTDSYEWVEKEKKYILKPSVLEKCVGIAQKYFPRVEGLEDIIESPYDTLQVAENAPLEVCKAAEKALRIIHHPDRAKDEDDREARNQFCQEIGEALKEIVESLQEEDEDVS
jgi:DnaJ-class molecular chaperone